MAKAKKASESTSVYVLLDRSGSMLSRWTNSIEIINGFMAGLKEIDGRVSVYAFDDPKGGWHNVRETRNNATIEILAKGVTTASFEPIDEKKVAPRGGTPLYDAIGYLAKVINGDTAKRGVVVIMTDGAENSSGEVNRETAKTLLDGIRARGWEVTQLGVDFDAYAEGQKMGVQAASVLNVNSANVRDTVDIMAGKARTYSSTGTVGTMTYTAEEKLKAGRK